MDRLKFIEQLEELYAFRSKTNGGSETKVMEYTVPPLKERKENGVFAHEESLGGITDIEDAKFTTSLPASPHVDYSIPAALFTKQLAAVYKERANLTVLDALSSELLPPHLIVWWKKQYQEHLPFPDIFYLPESQKLKIHQGIANQVRDALNLINVLSGNAYVAGTWGYASLQERMVSGLSRGGASNPIGHLHVADYSKSYRSSMLQSNLSLEDKVNFFRPLDVLLFEMLSGFIEWCLKKIGDEQDLNLNVTPDKVKTPDEKGQFFDGFNMSSPHGVTLTNALSILTNIAGEFDIFYNKLKIIHQKYWRGMIAHKELLEEVALLEICTKPLQREHIETLSNLVTLLHPTRMQLLAWGVNNDKIQRYDKIRSFIEKKQYHLKSNRLRYVYDMIRLTEDQKDVFFTMPERMSFGYIIRPEDKLKSDLENKEICVRALHLFPVFATKSTLIERYPGGIIRRAGS